MSAPGGLRTVLFDLDGTLTDPGLGITRCFAAALAERGLPEVAPERLRRCVGPPLRESFVALGARPEEVEPLVAAYRRRFREVGMFENQVYAGVPELLAALRDDGLVLHVATSKPTTFAEAILAHFGLRGCFDRVFGSELDGTRSDKGELLAHARAEAPFAPDTAALVGDRRFDVAAARAHGLLAVGVLWGYGTRAELAGAGADRLVATPAAVRDGLARPTLS